MTEGSKEIDFAELTVCGEIVINDGSTDVYLVCTFCKDVSNQSITFLRSLPDFIDHIKWHRSVHLPLSNSNQTINLEIVAFEADEQSDEEVEGNVTANPDKDEANEDFLNISDDQLVSILDLYKKCPCLWHTKSASRARSTVEPTYAMLTTYFNKLTNQNRSVQYVKEFITKLRDGFLEDMMSESSPWYFYHLMFLLMCDEEALDDSIYVDFTCSICSFESISQHDLWSHLCQCHIKPEAHLSSDEHDSRTAGEFLCNTSTDLMDKFIDAYKSQPRLWNKQHKEYFSRKFRNESYDMLLRILREDNDDATREDVKAKIHYLRSKFVLETNKMKQNQKSGVKYEPTTWYYEKLLFLDPELINNHPKVVSLIKNHSCTACDKTFTDETAWLDHMQCGHDNDEFQSADGFFYCSICNAQNKTKYMLIRHIRQSHTTKLNSCQDCGKQFNFTTALAKHRAKVHKDFGTFKCEECGKGFSNLTRMKTHSITHWNVKDRPHVCEHCGARFSNRANLKVHVRRHTRDFSFQCKLCNHKAATSTEMRFHMLTHTKQYPSLCDVCGKGFRSTALLATHNNECHGDAIFTCEVCDKQFMSERKLRYHSETHKLVNANCKDCGKKFARKSSLRKHVRLKHGDASDKDEIDDDSEMDWVF